MELNQWYKKGLSGIDYIESMDKLKNSSMHIYKRFTPPTDNAFLQSLKKKNLRVIVLAEDWCGHCMLNIPILLRLTEQVDMPVRFLRRDENLELMDQYLTNGKSRTIPIFIFIEDRKSTRLNSSHVAISYAVFCLKKKTYKSLSNT